MGRSSYTPSTISWLASQAGTESHDDSTAARQPRVLSVVCACSSSNAATSCSCVDAAKCSEELPPHSSSARRHKSDVPYNWSQRRFDPDDESLPVVDETFIDVAALDEQDEALRQMFDEEGVSVEDEESDAASNPDEEDNEVEAAAAYTEEVTEEILDDDDGSTWSLARPHEVNVTDEFRQAGFSPSVGVFHSHTLPFFLPAAGSMQRRASNEHAVTPSTGPIASEA